MDEIEPTGLTGPAPPEGRALSDAGPDPWIPGLGTTEPTTAAGVGVAPDAGG
ncbi:MAG TPA: hypothetical protein VMU76_07785 [Acidimicrobiales bacterium]|nr:hypothetical protein [Acidimicrobiales bacterium]